jgi:large subunit ribosomal protein L30
MARVPKATRKWKKKHQHRDAGRIDASAGPKLRVRQVRSGIAQQPVQRKTLEALGLKHHQDVVIHDNHPAIRGMLYRVRHLVEVTPVKE